MKYIHYQEDGTITGYTKFMKGTPTGLYLEDVELPEGFNAEDHTVNLETLELIRKPDEEILAREDATKIEAIRRAKKAAYETECDPLFWDYQEGKIDKQTWLDKKAEVRERIEK